MPNNKDFYSSSGGSSSQRHYGGGGADHRKSSSSSSGSRGKTEWRKTAFRVCGEWSEQFSSKGKIYYYNSRTEVSQWQRPREWTLGDPSPHDLAAARQNAMNSQNPSQSSNSHSNSSSANVMGSSSQSGSYNLKRPSSGSSRGSPGGSKRMKFGNNGSHHSLTSTGGSSSHHSYHRSSSSNSSHSDSRSHHHSSSQQRLQSNVSTSNNNIPVPTTSSSTSTIASVMRGVTAPTFYHHSQQLHHSHHQQQQQQQQNQQQQQHSVHQQQATHQQHATHQSHAVHPQHNMHQQQTTHQPQVGHQQHLPHQQHPVHQQHPSLQQQQSHSHHRQDHHVQQHQLQHPHRQNSSNSQHQLPPTRDNDGRNRRIRYKRGMDVSRRGGKSVVSRIDPTNDDMDISPDSSPCTSNDEDVPRPKPQQNGPVTSNSEGVDKIVAALRERLTAMMRATDQSQVDVLGITELLKKLISAATNSNVSNGPVKRVVESLESMLANGTFRDLVDGGNFVSLLQKGLEGMKTEVPAASSSNSGTAVANDNATESTKETKADEDDGDGKMDKLPDEENVLSCTSLESEETKKYVSPDVWERSQQMTQLSKHNYQATMEAWLNATPTVTPTLIDRGARRIELQADKLTDQVDRLTSIIYCDLCSELKSLRSLVRLSSMKVELTQQKRETLNALIETFEKRPHVLRN